jgi:hypothetical protein
MARRTSTEVAAFNALCDRISKNLATNPKWVEAAILALYEKQTEDEKVMQETGHDNGMGFSKPDARRMSYVAEFLKKGGHLTHEKALNVYARKLQKYTTQLAKIAQAKQAQSA